jgi:signal transduction histidine kinase
MRQFRIGMRWWLAGIFAMIGALTALLVASVSTNQVNRAVRGSAQDIAVGKAVSAAFSVDHAIGIGNLDKAVPVIARRRDLATFVFDRNGRLITPSLSRGVRWKFVPNKDAALVAAISGHRYVKTSDAGTTVVGLPLGRAAAGGALVAYAAQPPAYGESLAIFHREVIRAAFWAVLIAFTVGLVAAMLIARRLRGIGVAAAAIEKGDFEMRLQPRFRDEVGSLALTIDRMRRRLRDSFERLVAERDRLGRLLDQLQEGVVAVDRDLVVQFANENAATLGGPDLRRGEPLPERWAGIGLRELARGLFREDAALAEARAAGPDGRSLAVVGVPSGSSDLVVVVLSDITEQERRERGEREFVANASHELRTPVSAIASAVEALQSGASENPEERDAFIELIGRQSARLARLTRSLLIMARAQTNEEPIQLEPVELAPLLAEIAASSRERADVPLEVACPEGLIAIAQRDVAEQVVSNLVGNALKHTSEGRVRLSARPVNGKVLIEVSDTGPGIPADVRSRVFDRFYAGQGRGARDGFGLGLAIARDAVRALGGSIEIDSRPGRGTTARIVLAGEPRE